MQQFKMISNSIARQDGANKHRTTYSTDRTCYANFDHEIVTLLHQLKLEHQTLSYELVMGISQHKFATPNKPNKKKCCATAKGHSGLHTKDTFGRKRNYQYIQADTQKTSLMTKIIFRFRRSKFQVERDNINNNAID